MATVEFRTDTNDLACHLPFSDNDYFTALDSAVASEATEHTSVWAGQRFNSPAYLVYRGAICFDTSGLDDACLITSATLTLRCSASYASTVIIQSGMPTYPHIPQVVGDFQRTNYSGDGGSFIPEAGNNVVTLNAYGRDWINKTGYTKFILRSQAEINREAPTDAEYAVFYGNYTSEVSWRPKLTVVYSLPTGAPTVTSVGPCVDRQSTTMSAVGNVTDDGGGYEVRGFEYYEDTDNIYDSEMYAVREIGVFVGTGNFEMTINGLKPETTYQIRAWVKNSFGIAYGAWYTCITTAVPPVPEYGIHEETTTPTITFYLSEDDGMTYGQKHGPYTTDQADIEVTKLLVRGSGKKKIKFETTALTGISASVMVKLDCKAR